MKKILGDKEIDVYSLARLPEGPVEDIFKGLDTLKKEGLFGDVGASEMSAASLEKAHKVSHFLLLMSSHSKMTICTGYSHCYQ